MLTITYVAIRYVSTLFPFHNFSAFILILRLFENHKFMFGMRAPLSQDNKKFKPKKFFVFVNRVTQFFSCCFSFYKVSLTRSRNDLFVLFQSIKCGT